MVKLDEAHIPYAISGSAALYVQGHDRMPNDVDFMLPDEAFYKANKLFDIEPQYIERPYNSMNKSTPVDDGSVEFLNRYTARADGRSYYSPPLKTIPVVFNGRTAEFILAEEIAAYKLISRRNHHGDMEDFNKLFQHPNFNMSSFWKIVDSINARKIVADLLLDKH